MARYIDGFVLPVPKANLATYKRISRACSKIWKDHGCLQYLEAVEDDVDVGKWTSVPRSVKRKDGEVVIFAFAIFASRKARDTANKKIMTDPRMAKMMDPKKMPFDGKRMFWGGFKPFVDV
jgi:uncharacterized protein YbaA (DUF1428 family)